MLYSGDYWDKMLEAFDSLDFLAATSTNLDRLVKIYHVADSPLAIEISRNFYTTSRYEVDIIYFNANKEVLLDYTFEEFFDLLPQDAKEKIIFHLDLFN